MIEALVPADLGLQASLLLIAVSAATSFLTAAAGIGGGVALLAVMALVMPSAALIPVHGVVQIGSNAGRALIMLRGIERRILLPFCLGSLVGAGLGGMTVIQLPPAVLKTGLAAFILWSVWLPKTTPGGRFAVVVSGAFSSFLTMFFGATGPFVATMIKRRQLDRQAHVATHAACMVAQHGIKVAAFGLLGFAYGPYLGLIAAMIASGFLGTLLGRQLLLKMKDAVFHRVLAVVLTLLALRLLYDGLAPLLLGA